ncbi:MAG TPA: TraR/DksA family transcriptional regulator [Bryobacterales bacterium]|nr:TraR/DksA family transcriptional regulator [Bryobacterales bacterium]
MMSQKDLERHRRALRRIVETCDCRRRPLEQVVPATDMAEQAAVNLARYLAGLDEEIGWRVCEAAGRALTRMELGSFGRCLECGEEIGAKRLDAVPWASLCVICQEQIEARGDLSIAA